MRNNIKYDLKDSELKILLDFDRHNKYLINFSTIFRKSKKEIFNNVKFKFKHNNKLHNLDIKEILTSGLDKAYFPSGGMGINIIKYKPITHILFLDIEDLKHLTFKNNIKLTTDVVLNSDIDDFLITWSNVNLNFN